MPRAGRAGGVPLATAARARRHQPARSRRCCTGSYLCRRCLATGKPAPEHVWMSNNPPQIDRSQHSRKNGNKLFRSHFSAQNLSKTEMRCLTAAKKSTVPLSLSCRPVTSSRDRVRRCIHSGGGTATALALALALALFTRHWASDIVVASYVEAATGNEVHKQIL